MYIDFGGDSDLKNMNIKACGLFDVLNNYDHKFYVECYFVCL